MQKETSDKVEQSDPKKRNIVIAGVALVIIVLIFVIVQLVSGPQRSVAAYCQTFKEEKARLAKLPGDTWPTGVFNEELSDAGEIAASFSKLEKVAPDDIRPDIATLQSIYQKIDSDPSQAISASLSGVSAETNVKDWAKNHCSIEQ